jgi:hypothetical protein
MECKIAQEKKKFNPTVRAQTYCDGYFCFFTCIIGREAKTSSSTQTWLARQAWWVAVVDSHFLSGIGFVFWAQIGDISRNGFGCPWQDWLSKTYILCVESSGGGSGSEAFSTCKSIAYCTTFFNLCLQLSHIA